MMKRQSWLLILCAIFLCLMCIPLSSVAENLVNPPGPTGSEQLSGDYRIGPEDILEISVWKNQDLSAMAMVRPDGMISMPLLGDIQASGKTPIELRDAIMERLKEFKEEPTVSIIVKEVNSHAFFIMGEIARPGKYPLKSETTILQAITIAGGFTQWADKDKVLVLRKSPSQPEGQRIIVRYKYIVSGKDPKANIGLKPGDTIIVP